MKSSENNKEKVVSIEKLSKEKAPGIVSEPNKKITRQEFADVIQQLGEEIGIVQQGLVDSVNALYAQQLFPFQLEIWAFEKLCIDKGLFTKEELDEVVEDRKKDLIARAEQIRENQDGKLEKVPEEEAVYNENKAIVKANFNKDKK